MSVFIKPEIRVELENIIREKLLTQLNQQHFNLLIDKLCQILDDIFILFNMPDAMSFQELLYANNNRDLIGLFLLLLPYINTASLPKLREIHYLNEIYETKKEECDISIKSPSYLFTNIQYDRCHRNPLRQIQFDPTHLEQNFQLLRQTLKMIANRMYVNWINVVPILLQNYQTKSIYRNTQQVFQNHAFSDMKPKRPMTPELSISTVYETIYHHLYAEIKNLKWLLYDFDTNKNIVYDLTDKISDSPPKVSSLIQILYNPEQPKQIKLNLDHCFNGASWDEMTNEDREKFQSEWYELCQMNTQLDFEVLKTIVFAFENYENRKHLKTSISVRDFYYATKILLFSKLQNVKVEIIYEFLRETLHQFRSTYYYKFLYDPDIKKDLGQIRSVVNGMDIILTPKNIYNFAKSMCSMSFDDDDEENFMRLPAHWVSLPNSDRDEFINRLNMSSNSWFDISGNVARIYPPRRYDVSGINNAIQQMCSSNLIKIVFECLITNGTLTEFVFQKPELQQYEEGFYYLNGIKYKDIEMYYKEEGYDYTPMKYIDYLQDREDKSYARWKQTYAMNWVSQINFFHKYLHQRLILVTGGTGVGKSTQIPKLLMYALKMLDWKNTGKVICSQPRKKPTNDNAVQIATEMGVSIKIKEGIEPNTYHPTNYNVQFQHHDQKFPLEQNKREAFPILRIVTDKILLNSISNPLFKKKFNDVYTLQNLFDIIIVDEAHEHNENMDMILTLMKRVLNNNNDCKLVIISATMEYDEPIYRRFYRDINDNQKFPLNQYLEEWNLDRVNIDRRLDISEPGKADKLIIHDNYLDVQLYPFGARSETLKSGNAELIRQAEQVRNQMIVQKVKEILQNPLTKDILVFKTGQKEILECAKQLNETIQSDAIAIPYFGELPQKMREFIERIHLEKHKVHIPKSVDILSIDDPKDLENGTEFYNHIIIIATNIAEASITIATLTDVIDDGLQKVNVYYPEQNGSIIETKKISELNRKQRRGRVGRTMDGSVYYLYPEGSLVGEPNIYKICINDITDTLFSLLRSDKEEILFDTSNDLGNIRESNINKLQNIYKYGIDQIVKKQYFIGKNLYEYKGNASSDFQNSEITPEQYVNGFSYQTLLDTEGKFYVIHPNENNFVRNILGKITSTTANTDRIEKSIEKLSVPFLIFDQSKQNKIFDYVKTPYGSMIESILHRTFMEIFGLQYAIACAFGQAYGCLDEVIKIVSMLHFAVARSIELPKNTIDDNNSDLLVLLKQMEKLLKTPSEDLDKKFDRAIVEIYRENIKHLMDTEHASIGNITQYLNQEIIQRHVSTYSKEDLIALSFLHAFGMNIVKKLNGTKYYLPLKYPLESNIKVAKKTKTCVSNQYLHNYLLHISSYIHEVDEIANGEMLFLQYVEPKLLELIAYQFPLPQYLEEIKKKREEIKVSYKISEQYNETMYYLIGDIKKIHQQNPDSMMIFSNVSKEAFEFIQRQQEANQKYLQSGGRKYRII